MNCFSCAAWLMSDRSWLYNRYFSLGLDALRIFGGISFFFASSTCFLSAERCFVVRRGWGRTKRERERATARLLSCWEKVDRISHIKNIRVGCVCGEWHKMWRDSTRRLFISMALSVYHVTSLLLLHDEFSEKCRRWWEKNRWESIYRPLSLLAMREFTLSRRMNRKTDDGLAAKFVRRRFLPQQDHREPFLRPNSWLKYHPTLPQQLIYVLTNDESMPPSLLDWFTKFHAHLYTI